MPLSPDSWVPEVLDERRPRGRAMPELAPAERAPAASPARSPLDAPGPALAVCAALALVYAVLARCVLDAFPFSGDEYSLLLQAQLFARGLLHAPAPPHAAWLRVDHVVIDHVVRSKYPPGTSAMLALGVRAGFAWLVTPIEAVIALVLVWHATRRLLGPRPALVALVTLGLAPLFAFQAATFYAHTAATMFLAAAFAAIAAWTQGRRTRWLALAGAAIGVAFLTRPCDALLFGIAMLALGDLRAVAITAGCALPLVGLDLAYRTAQFGSPLMDGYRAYAPAFRALYGARAAAPPLSAAHLASAVQWWNHLDVYRALVIDWTIPGCALVAVLGARVIGRDHPARAMRTFSLALIATFATALLVMIADADDGARPRYLSIVLIPLAFLTAAGFAPACEVLAAHLGRRLRTIVIVSAVVCALAQLAAFLQRRVPQVWEREGLYQAARREHLRDAVVLVRARHPSRYARNGPFFRGVLYLSVPPATTAAEVAAAYPGKAVWIAREGVPWTLRRVR